MVASAGVVPRTTGGTGAAVGALHQTVIWLAVGLRGAVPVVGSGLVLLGATGHDAAGLRWLAAGVCLWALWFGWYGVRRGLAGWLVTVDWVVAMATIVALGLLGRAGTAGPAGPTLEWAAVIASMSVIVVQLAWPARVSVPVGLATAVLFAVVLPDRAAHVGVLVLQTGSAALVIALARRASRAGQGVLDDYHTARRTAAVSQARRADERAQARRLHDTALSTLTMVATGAVPGPSAVLRARAAEDHLVIAGLAEPDPADAEMPARLDLRLAELVARYPGLSVTGSVPALRLPRSQVEAIADAVGEALANAARHAGVSDVELTARVRDSHLLVEVTDRGHGFDSQSVPAHRYGVRESIVGRMRAAGATAVVSSAPGRGTTVQLRCPYG